MVNRTHRLPPARGGAIVTAMFAIVLISVLVTSMIRDQQTQIRLDAQRLKSAQARTLLLGGEQLAAQQLLVDKEKAERQNSDSMEDGWAQTVPVIPIYADALLSGCIFDMQGRFNLNNLIDAQGNISQKHYMQLERLLEHLTIDKVKAAAIADWLDKNSNVLNAYSAEYDFYSSKQPAYSAANRPMADLSELRLIKGFHLPDDREDYLKLLPHVSALPNNGKPSLINVNTASVAVIVSLAVHTSASIAETLSRLPNSSEPKHLDCQPPEEAVVEESTTPLNAPEPKREPYTTVQQFQNEYAKQSSLNLAHPELVGVQSEYFMVYARIVWENIDIVQTSLIWRAQDGKTTIVQREYAAQNTY